MRSAFITGTSKGLGKSIANHLLNKNWRVIGMSRSDGDIYHENYMHIKGDVSSYASVESCFDSVKPEQIDLLVNNSAIFEYKSFDDTDMSIINHMIDVNLKGPIYVTKCAMSVLKENSRIIFINSVAGLEQIENQSIYCATKHGLTGFAGVLGKELQEKKIKVTSIHPGGINTPLWNNLEFHEDTTKLLDPDQIAKLVEFICDSQKNVEYKTIKMFPDIEWHQ
jgi:short-subunit dehydrogenase